MRRGIVGTNLAVVRAIEPAHDAAVSLVQSVPEASASVSSEARPNGVYISSVTPSRGVPRAERREPLLELRRVVQPIDHRDERARDHLLLIVARPDEEAPRVRTAREEVCVELCDEPALASEDAFEAGF